VDVYGLGVVLFELLTKTLPFGGATVADMLLAILTQPAPDVRELNPDVPPALADLIASMLAKEPHDRPKSAADAERRLKELAEILAGKPLPGSQINIETVGTGSAASRASAAKAKRPPWLIFAIAGGACAVLIGLSLLFFGKKEKKAEFVAPSVAQQKQVAVAAADLQALKIVEVVPEQATVFVGERATFKITLANQAKTAEQNPAMKLAGARTVCQFQATLRALPGGMAAPAPMLPLRLSPRQLPAPNGTSNFRLQFTTESLSPGNYVAKISLEAPDNSPVMSSEIEFKVARNFKNVSLEKAVRTWEGRGADATVRLGLADDFGAAKDLIVDVARGKDSPEARSYFRFDLSRSKVPKGKFTQAVLAVTMTKDSAKEPRNLRVWGVIEGKDGGEWKESGEMHITWETVPGNNDMAASKFLGTMEFDNTGGVGNAKPDALRFASPELDDFIRADTDGLLTLYLTLKEGGGGPTKIASKEEEPSQSPSLTLLED
jgi:hypothetical protein